NIDVQQVTEEFLTYYYEDAAPIMKKYLDEMENVKIKSNIDIETGDHSFYTDASKSYMSKQQIINYYRLLYMAKLSAQKNQEVVNRIELDEIGLLIFEIELEKKDKKIP